MGTMYERIEILCAKRGIKPGKLCADTGLSRGMMSDLKMGRTKELSAKSAKTVADYFGVSVGYLMGEEIENAPTVSGERDILNDVDIAFYGDYKELTEDDKETLRAMARLMRERRARMNQEN